MNKSVPIVIAVVVLAIIGGVVWMNVSKEDSSKQTSDTQTNTQSTEQQTQKSNTIVDVAAGNSEFSTLVDLIKTADLASTLSGEGPFTVFAPTNAAFAKLPADTLASIKADKTKLASILTYHVVAGKVAAADVVKLTEATTVNGAKVSIAVKDGKVVLNDSATVTATDIMADNGIIHVIDTVILPPAQ